jgi:hypothetical protein
MQAVQDNENGKFMHCVRMSIYAEKV